jgi:two-component system sensor histidine kinase/response regulator
VADDNDVTRSVLMRQLVRMGLEADAVPNGAMALEAVQRMAAEGTPYDLVLMDWRMPGMDGIRTSRAIRELRLRPSPKIVCVTAAGTDELSGWVEASDFEGVLVKPVTGLELHAEILAQFGRGPNPALIGERATLDLMAKSLANIAGARVLLVDDNPLNQQVGTELLRQLGLEVEVAEHGAQALEKLEAGDCELVLMDLQMPVMDGLTATREIRANPRWRDLPVLAMTANVQPSDRAQCQAAGMNDFIGKPIEPEVLSAALLSWIPARAAARTERRSEPAAAPSPAGWRAEELRIEGLDTDAGLRRCGGKPGFYLSMLRRFVEHWGALVDDFGRLVDTERWDDAHRMAHSLKGVAGSLGAGQVQRAALQLEIACRAQIDAPGEAKRVAVAEALADLATLLDPLIRSLGQKLPGADPEAAPSRPGGPGFDDLRPGLLRLLEDGDTDVLELVRRNATKLRESLGDRFEAFDRAVRDFDFETAAAMIAGGANPRD